MHSNGTLEHLLSKVAWSQLSSFMGPFGGIKISQDGILAHSYLITISCLSVELSYLQGFVNICIDHEDCVPVHRVRGP